MEMTPGRLYGGGALLGAIVGLVLSPFLPFGIAWIRPILLLVMGAFLGGFVGGVVEIVTRPNLEHFCEHLRDWGIPARMTQRLPDDALPSYFWGMWRRPGSQRTKGVITIGAGPIRKVSQLEYMVDGEGEGAIHESRTSFWVPDSRVGKELADFSMHTEREWTFLLKVRDVYWTGDDRGLGLYERLNADQSLRQPIMESHDVGVSVSPDASGWNIFVQREVVPSRSKWDCYQRIANHLLATPIPQRHYRRLVGRPSPW